MRKSLFGYAALTAAAAAGAAAAYVYAVRPWHLRWGATPAEATERLPGDELVADPRSGATHAVTIEAPASEVWPWLAQIGQDKGGFYSYAWLENMVGCRLRNADRIMPEFQELKVGDSVRLHPKAPPLPVVVCDPPRTLVLGSNTDTPGTWGFHLRELDGDRTRLVVRARGDWKPGLAGWLINRVVFEPAHFIMERKMMLGIKGRAESLRRSLNGGGLRQEQGGGRAMVSGAT